MHTFKTTPPPTGELLNQIHPSSQVEKMSDVVSAWQAIDAGVTPKATKDQEKYCK